MAEETERCLNNCLGAQLGAQLGVPLEAQKTRIEWGVKIHEATAHGTRGLGSVTCCARLMCRMTCAAPEIDSD
jgi:hypothetical protein